MLKRRLTAGPRATSMGRSLSQALSNSCPEWFRAIKGVAGGLAPWGSTVIKICSSVLLLFSHAAVVGDVFLYQLHFQWMKATERMIPSFGKCK